MIKARVNRFVTLLGLTTKYCGKSKKMFVIGKGARRVKDLAKTAFPDLPFKVAESKA